MVISIHKPSYLNLLENAIAFGAEPHFREGEEYQDAVESAELAGLKNYRSSI